MALPNIIHTFKQMKRNLLVLSFFLAAFQLSAQTTQASLNDTRSDSIDILKTTISLAITDFTNNTIAGNTKVKIQAKVNNINTLYLDLLSLTVDSVKKNSQLLTYTYANDVISIVLPTTLNQNAIDSITVYYHGAPVTDASGFGGFYFSSDDKYAYNIGVGFADQPHNLGRCWFPTFDNFVERFLLEEHITVLNTYSAVCNGTLQNITSNGSTKTYHWVLRDEIPSYLASVAVAAYVPVTKSFPTIAGGNIPVLLYARAADTTFMKNSFVHLKNAFDTFEDRFGPYRWERVGYVIVPFMAGAMEHATNIGYPAFAVTGTLTFETTMAHELSHHWFGDLVTCDKAEEMYINEGFARYCEAIFLEGVYGATAYRAEIKKNHLEVLNFTHVKDAGFYPLANVPQAYTYGSTSYEKGADVVHTLRSYMGDTDFFDGIKSFLNTNPFTDVNSYTLRDDLENATGQLLHPFFDDWVLSEGFPHFAIDSFAVAPNGSQYNVTVFVRQRLKNAPHLYTNVPFNVSIRGGNGQESINLLWANSANCQATYTVPFYPVFAALNMDDRISHAITSDEHYFKQAGSVSLFNALCTINATAVGDSVLVYAEHNWIAPDNITDPNDVVTLSTQRYWRISGIYKAGFFAKGTFVYNGKTPAAGNSGWLDNELITTTEDSLILMYRPGPGYAWKKCPYSTLNTQGSSTDKIGRFEVDSLRFGEYCLAKGTATVGIKEQAVSATTKLLVYPNPANNVVTIEADRFIPQNTVVTVVSSIGSVVKTINTAGNSSKLTVDLSGLAQGVYYIRIGSSAARVVVM